MRLLFTGDSITDCGHMFEAEGLGDGYVRMIAEAMPEHTIINRGYDGYIAQRMFRAWDGICIENDPDVVTCLVGVNDVCAHITGGGGYDAAGYGDWIRKIVDTTREKTHAQVILMEPFLFPWPEEYLNWMDTLQLFREELKSIATELSTGWLPLWDLFVQAQREYNLSDLTVDGIHLAKKGHELLAKAWMDYFYQR